MPRGYSDARVLQQNALDLECNISVETCVDSCNQMLWGLCAQHFTYAAASLVCLQDCVRLLLRDDDLGGNETVSKTSLEK